MRIFLSYRRNDSSAWAGWLHESLSTRIGQRNIFQDVLDVDPGEDFTAALDRALDHADATLAVIGPTWLTVTSPDGTRRLDEADDYVRAEVTAALVRGGPVIPVLVGGAAMPRAVDLPAGLEGLATRQAWTLHDETWGEDVDGLLRALRGERPGSGRRRWPIAAGAAVLVLAGVVALVLVRDGDSGNSGDDERASSGELTGCPDPRSAPASWEPIGVTGEPRVEIDGPEGSWTVEVLDGLQRVEGAEWVVVLGVSATNGTNDVVYHDSGAYVFAVDGIEFPPLCLSVLAGSQPLSPDSRDQAQVGFLVTVEPAAADDLDLDVEFADQTERLDLDGSPG